MINLVKARLRLEDGPSASPIAEGEERKDHPGRVVGIVEARQPEDLHPSMWEMHPDGDEILHLIDGSVRIVVEGPEGVKIHELNKGDTFIVPQGSWHRFERQGPCDLLFITRGSGTEFRAFND